MNIQEWKQPDGKLLRELRILSNPTAAQKQMMRDESIAAIEGGAQRVVHAEEVGLNDECPCGSKKKFKKCCMYSESAKRTIEPPKPVA